MWFGCCLLGQVQKLRLQIYSMNFTGKAKWWRERFCSMSWNIKACLSANTWNSLSFVDNLCRLVKRSPLLHSPFPTNFHFTNIPWISVFNPKTFSELRVLGQSENFILFDFLSPLLWTSHLLLNSAFLEHLKPQAHAFNPLIHPLSGIITLPKRHRHLFTGQKWMGLKLPTLFADNLKPTPALFTRSPPPKKNNNPKSEHQHQHFHLATHSFL